MHMIQYIGIRATLHTKLDAYQTLLPPVQEQNYDLPEMLLVGGIDARRIPAAKECRPPVRL